MANEITVFDKEYSTWVQELKNRYLQQRLKAHSAVINYCLEFYWSLGKDIVSIQSENRYGSGFYNRLSNDLKNELPGVKGLAPTNLKYMKYYYEFFKGETENRPQLADDLRSIPWGTYDILLIIVKEILNSAVPIGISEYELSKLYPTDFKSSMPTIEEIEESLKDKE